MAVFNVILTVLLIGSYNCFVQGSTQQFEGCSPGKYYWRHNDPTTYFVCMPFSKQAYEMSCGAGTYMCKKPATRFAPCSCNQKELEVWGAKDDLTVVNTKIESTYGGGTERQISYNFLSKVSKNLNGERRDGSTDSPHSRDKGYGVPTVWPDGVKAKYAQYGSMVGREIALNDDRSGARSDSTGCKMMGAPEVDTVRYMGDAKPQYTSRKDCLEGCRTTQDCWGVSWDKMDPPPVEGRCYFLKEFSFMIPKSKNKCCDVYEKMDCRFSTPDQTTYYPSTTPSTSTTSTTSTTTTTTTTPSPPTSTTDSRDANDNSQRKSAESAPLPPLPAIPRTTEIPTTTTTIPDTGCPFELQRMDGKSHPFGGRLRNLNTIEKCKRWCVQRSYCKAVDFNTVDQFCYYVREIAKHLLRDDPNVVHFQRIKCGKPLNCWSHTSQGTPIVQVTDPNIPRVQCSGTCYSREIIGTNGQSAIERGCIPTRIQNMDLGCKVPQNDPLTINCYCDTDMCNGLSINSQSSQTLYLPLNGDFVDHSGMFRETTIVDNFQLPEFSCLDRVTNCSAVFLGSQCLAVKSLEASQWGQVNTSGVVVPAASFVVWFKRRSGSSSMQGIFGNSMAVDMEPSWQMATEARANYVSAGIVTDVNSNINDYRHVAANDNTWHLAVMTYDGRNDPANDQFPILQFYLDGRLTLGNARADTGGIAIRSQPVTIGCVKDAPFTGFIDEVRIFTSILTANDIQAIMLMRDTNVGN